MNDNGAPASAALSSVQLLTCGSCPVDAHDPHVHCRFLPIVQYIQLSPHCELCGKFSRYLGGLPAQGNATLAPVLPHGHGAAHVPQPLSVNAHDADACVSLAQLSHDVAPGAHCQRMAIALPHGIVASSLQ